MRKFLLGIFLLLSLFLFTSTTGAWAKDKNVRFIQVSDVHYVSENEQAQKWLEALVKEINSTENVDFVVFTGDNIDSPNVKYLHDFLKTVGKINRPCYFVIGNHDVSTNSGLNKPKYLDVIRYHNWFSPAWKPNYTFRKNGYLFVVVDGAKQVIPGPNGYYKQDTLAWLDKVLTKNKKKQIVILQHFPLIEPRKMTSHKTYMAEKYLELLDKHENVIAVVSGHYHQNHEVMRNDVYHVSSPAFAEEPHYFKVIEIVAGQNLLPMIFTQLREFDL